MSLSSSAASSRPTAIAVHGIGATEDLLNEILGARGFAPVQMVGSIGELTAQLRTRNPTLVLVPVPAGGVGNEFSLFENELRRHPGVAAIGVAPSKDADTVIAAMRAGVLEFLVAPVDPSELATAAQRVLSHVTAPSDRGRIFTVYSAKGGLGTTTLATSLAWSLAHRGGSPRVALVDFTTTGAGLRVMLDLQPLYDLGSVANRTAKLDTDFLASCLVKHSEGVYVLAAAEELDAVDPLDVATAGRVLELLRAQFDFVVVDTDHHFADQTLAALDAADRIVLVTQADVSALRSSQRTLGVFTRLGYTGEKMVIVINRRTDRDRISVGDAERVLGLRADTRLPNDYASCADAITYGRFLQQQAPSSPLVAAVDTLAAMLAGDKSAETVTSNGNGQHGGSRLARLFGRK
jgi:pilus assembly protein CpaE